MRYVVLLRPTLHTDHNVQGVDVTERLKTTAFVVKGMPVTRGFCVSAQCTCICVGGNNLFY